MFLELSKKRRSVREFSGKKVSDEDLNTILKSLMYSPTAKNRDVIRYIVIRNREILKELSTFKEVGCQFIENCDLAIAVLANKEIADKTFSQDASVAATHIMFSCADLNLGCCWANVIDLKDAKGNLAIDNIRRILNVDEKYWVECIMAIGHPKTEVKEKKPFNIEDHVDFI